MPKTDFIKYKQFTAARFNIGNLTTLVTYDKLYIERLYVESSVEFQGHRKFVIWFNVNKAGRVYGG